MENKDNSGLLFDNLIRMNKLKNDAALARLLKVAPPVVSKIRHGKLPVGPSMILYIHEHMNLPVWNIRQMILAGK